VYLRAACIRHPLGSQRSRLVGHEAEGAVMIGFRAERVEKIIEIPNNKTQIKISLID
jgi:hypothetical protein